MKTPLTIFFWAIIIHSTTTQTLEFAGGFNHNKYVAWKKTDSSIEEDLGSGLGNYIELSIAGFKIHSLPAKISFRLENYRGSIFTPTNLSLQSAFGATVRNTVIGIGFYPINFPLFKDFNMSFGIEFNYRLLGQTDGNIYAVSGTSQSVYRSLSDGVRTIHEYYYFGTSGAISYQIKIVNGLFLTPHYRFHLGISNEFRSTKSDIKSIRQNIGIGIKRLLKQ